jgi:hypothetical protein
VAFFLTLSIFQFTLYRHCRWRCLVQGALRNPIVISLVGARCR